MSELEAWKEAVLSEREDYGEFYSVTDITQLESDHGVSLYESRERCVPKEGFNRGIGWRLEPVFHIWNDDHMSFTLFDAQEAHAHYRNLLMQKIALEEAVERKLARAKKTVGRKKVVDDDLRGKA